MEILLLIGMFLFGLVVGVLATFFVIRYLQQKLANEMMEQMNEVMSLPGVADLNELLADLQRGSK